MLRSFFLTLVCFFSCHVLFAQQANSLLWEISGNGLQSSSYLFGSIHLTDERVFNLPDSVLPKMKQCDAVLCELDLDSAMNDWIVAGMKKARKKVSDILSQEEIEHLQKKFKKNKIDIGNDFQNETPYSVYLKYKYKKLKTNEQST